VLRRYVLAALASAIEAGNDEVARAAVRRGDWILRGPGARMLESALIDAMLVTGDHVSSADPEVMRHVLRVAALGVAGRNDFDATDRVEVAATYYETEEPHAGGPPVATIAACSIFASLLLAIVWFGVSLRHPDHRPRPDAPLPAGAYFHGGAPATDAELERFLDDEMTSLVIETDADRRGSRDGAPRARHIAELRDAKIIAARGGPLAHSWRELIDAIDRWAGVSGRGKHVRAAAAELGRKAQDVSEQLAALGLGYYLQADTIKSGSESHAGVFVFKVEKVVFVRAGRDARRVLDLRRLDRLNLRYALLGRQGDELGDPVVLLDQIDDLVREKIEPVMDGAPYPLAESMLGMYAGAAIRGELAPYRHELAEVVTATVRRHEARHAVDVDRATPLRYPQALAKLLGPRGAGTKRAELELAAYTSQIGNEPVMPHFALWNLASHTFNRYRAGTAEAYVGVVVIEGLARELGVEVQPSVVGGRIDYQRLRRVAEVLAVQPGDKIQAASRALWVELYGEPLLPIR
jgi:hypothetical protein